MFGELLGFFIVNLWQQMGEPRSFTLLELLAVIAIIPTMSFLAYRFIPACLIIVAIFWRRVRDLSRLALFRPEHQEQLRRLLPNV